MFGSGTVQFGLVKTFLKNQLIPLQIYTNFNRNEMKNIGLIGNLGEDRNSFFQNFSIANDTEQKLTLLSYWM
jgi:hypothetical protein